MRAIGSTAGAAPAALETEDGEEWTAAGAAKKSLSAERARSASAEEEIAVLHWTSMRSETAEGRRPSGGTCTCDFTHYDNKDKTIDH